MAARYNEALRAHLGLPPSPPDAAKASRLAPVGASQMTLIPAVGPGHIGLALEHVFATFRRQMLT